MKKKSSRELLYALYEMAVQTPQHHADLFALIYADLNGKSAKTLREDFCGTFKISLYWVKRNLENKALALDIDPEPLGIGKKDAKVLLSAKEQKRLKVFRKNVFSITAQKADIVAACNFSFFFIQERHKLVEYFKKVRASLKKDGILILEVAGGPGMIEKTKERKTIRLSDHPDVEATKKNLKLPKKFRYIWDQKNFNPIGSQGEYAIHFELGNFLWKDAFTYDWRVWNIADIRDCMKDAGFRSSSVYWEPNRYPKSKLLADHEYARLEKGENYYSWISYVVAQA